MGEREVKIGSRGPGDPGRTAKLSLSAGPIRVARPRHWGDRNDPEYLDLSLVEAREAAPPPGTEAVHWRLITTLPAADLQSAQKIVQIYRLRWRIEQVFGATQNAGLGLPDIQMQDAARRLKMAALAIGATVRTIQLVDSRDGGVRPASDVADANTLEAAAAIGPTLEGNTLRRQNPHPPHSLPRLSWIVARLGGWNCYYKPPGPKTMRAGWDRLAAMAAGYHIAKGVSH